MQASAGGLTLFAQDDPAGVARHRLPVWKVVLPLRGHVTMPDVADAPGVVVPPLVPNVCAASSGFVALFVDPGVVRVEPGVLDARRVRRLLAAVGSLDAPDLGAVRDELGRPVVLDPRVRHALDGAVGPGCLGDIAGEVGLSPPRLRTLVRESVGVPLLQLRRWARLRDAVAALHGNVPAADAAARAGFADQAHFTRTARALIGRTPSSLRLGHQGSEV